MTETRPRSERMLDKLGQRETWSYVAGIALGAVAVIGSVAFGEKFDEAGTTAVIISVIGALLGTGATAQIKRGQQRGESIAQDVVKQVQAVEQEYSDNAN